MKRGKGEEKLIGPMFPRLHVNDTEKGGPRAPPRNKMALYEQFSIPSQRFKHGISSDSENANCQQGNERQRDVFFPAQLPPSRHPAEKPHSCSSNSKTPLLPAESNKKTEEDDFRVPVFVKSKVDQGNRKLYSTLDGRKLSAFGAVLPGHSKKDLNEQNSKQLAVSREHSCNSTSVPSMDKLDDFLKKADVPLQYEPRDDPDNTPGIFCKTDLLRPECGVDSQVGGTMLSEPVTILDNGDSSLLVKDVATKEQTIPNNNRNNDTESKEDKASESLQTRVVDQGDDLSETTMVESISGMYISPDDVVGIIGLKRFWNARRAIANQQRAFAVQVFELHRLIKVQRLIAGSQSTLEAVAYLDKPVKDLSAKRLPLEYIVRDGHNVSNQRKDFEKPNTRMECSAENTVRKSVKDSSTKRLPLEYIVRDGHNVSNQRKDFEKPNTRMECSAENTVRKSVKDSSIKRLPLEYIVRDGHNVLNQKKDAEKPDVSMECSAENTLCKPVKDSSGKRLPLEFIIRDGHNVSNQRKDFEKPNTRMECSAENTVHKSVKDSSTKRLPLEYIVRDGHDVSNQRKDSAKPNTSMECSAENTVRKSVKDSSTKRLPLEYIVRDGRNVSKQKDSKNPDVSMECSAENTVEKASFSSVQNCSQPSSYSLFSGHPITNDSTMGPWSFNQPSGHQWLVPVMTPSEGLVYKPYPGPGVTSPVCGGYGPPPSVPSYGIPAFHHQYQGVTMPFAPPAGHTYFPPYGMPVINPAISSSAVDQSNQLSGGEANFYVQRQNSSNVPNDKNRTVPYVKSHSSRDVEMQASTATSPSGATNRRVADNATEGTSVLPLFPTTPPAAENPDSSSQPHVPSHPARVIRVVPRNPRSATESAARIFQSIQEERKQYDSSVNHL